jgi:hypothetical protein
MVVGLAAAAGLKLPSKASLVLGAIGGVAAGAAANIDNPGIVAAIGAGLASFLVGGCAFAGFEKIEPFVPLARRVVGAWIAAIGMLLLTLGLQR